MVARDFLSRPLHARTHLVSLAHQRSHVRCLRNAPQEWQQLRAQNQVFPSSASGCYTPADPNKRRALAGSSAASVCLAKARRHVGSRRLWDACVRSTTGLAELGIRGVLRPGLDRNAVVQLIAEGLTRGARTSGKTHITKHVLVGTCRCWWHGARHCGATDETASSTRPSGSSASKEEKRVAAMRACGELSMMIVLRRSRPRTVRSFM